MSKANPGSRSARPVPPPPAPQLMLVLQGVIDGAVLAEVSAVLAAVPVAAVVMTAGGGDPRGAVEQVRAMAGPVQAAGAALLVDGPVEVAVRGGADGIHVGHDMARVLEAIERVKPERIVGVGDLRSRDDAMSAGEAGADYVWFGPKAGASEALPSVLERVAWWAELFETPVVASAPNLAAIGDLVAAGADFVALTLESLAAEGGGGAGAGRAQALLATAHNARAGAD